MAEFYDINDQSTNKLWSKELWSQFRHSDAVFDDRHGFLGKDPDSNAFVLVDDMMKSTGDEVTITIRHQVAPSRGVIGDEVLEGKEFSITTKPFKFHIDDQLHGWQSRGIMNGQRVKFDTLEESKNGLLDWWKTRRAVAAVNHLCSNTRQTDVAYTGLNAVQAIDTGHIYRVNQGLGASNDQTVGADATAKFDVNIIDDLVTIAESSDVPIKPFMFKGAPHYGMFIHPYSAADLRASSSKWYDVMKSALQGGYLDDNPLFTRAMGVWRNVIIFVEPYIVQGTHSGTSAAVSNSRRNVFFGAGALALAYGRTERGTLEHFRWHNGTWDHGRKFYGSAGCVWGMAAPRFEDPDGTTRANGRIICTCYSLERITSSYPDKGQSY